MTLNLEIRDMRPRHRTWRYLLAILLLVVLIITLTITWSSWHDQALYEEAIIPTNELDAGWRWEDIQTGRKMADEVNGAKIATEAIYMLGIDEVYRPKSQWEVDYYKLLDSPGFESFTTNVRIHPQARIDPAKLKLLQSLLSSNPGPRAIEIARRLYHAEHGCFQLNHYGPLLFQTLDSDVQSARGLCSVLEYDSWIQCEVGQTDVALVNVGAMLGICRSIGDESSDICQYVRLACDSVASRNFQRVLAQSADSSPERLKQLQIAFQKESSQPILQWVIKGHRAAIDHDLTLLQSGKVSVTKWGLGTMPIRWETGWKYLDKRLMECFPRQMIDQEYAPSPWHIERAALHRYCNGALLIADQLEQKWPRLIREYNDLMVLPNYVSEALRVVDASAPKSTHPSTFEKLSKAILRARAHTRCSAAACAAERFRIDSKRMPEKWQDVVPKYLDVVPIDPFNGQPILLRRLADGLVIYSVGPDGKDDLGDVLPTVNSEMSKDVGVRLWNVSNRRQPSLIETEKPKDEKNER